MARRSNFIPSSGDSLTGPATKILDVGCGHGSFLKPNVWNHNIWIIRLVPERLHDFSTRRLSARQEHDTYPKQYKMNSVRKISRVLGSIGFKKFHLILNGDLSYVSFNDLLFKLACLAEKVLDFKWLQFAKVHIIGIYER